MANAHSSHRRGGRARGLRLSLVAAPTLVLLLLASGLTAAPSPAAAAPAPAAQAKSSCPWLGLSTPVCHVFFIFLENQEWTTVLKRFNFEAYLAKHYAFASQFYSIKHNSFPAYSAATSGYAHNPIVPLNRTNVVDLLHKAGPAFTWNAYYGGMVGTCNRTVNLAYRPSHNPFVWYNDVYANQTECNANDVNLSVFQTEYTAGTLPVYGFISPNVTDECLKVGAYCDPWLRSFLNPLLNSTLFNSSVFFVTYDEGPLNDTTGANGGAGGGHVFTAVMSPFACAAKNSTSQYNHYNLLTTTEWLLHLGRLGVPGDSWIQHPPMKDLFCFANNGNGSVGPWVVLSPFGGGSHAPSYPTSGPILAVVGRAGAK